MFVDNKDERTVKGTPSYGIHQRRKNVALVPRYSIWNAKCVGTPCPEQSLTVYASSRRYTSPRTPSANIIAFLWAFLFRTWNAMQVCNARVFAVSGGLVWMWPQLVLNPVVSSPIAEWCFVRICCTSPELNKTKGFYCRRLFPFPLWIISGTAKGWVPGCLIIVWALIYMWQRRLIARESSTTPAGMDTCSVWKLSEFNKGNAHSLITSVWAAQ